MLKRVSGQKEIKIRTLFSDDDVTVEVEDSGFGIVTPDRILEAFFTSKDEGIGLGLPISRSIAKAHGGALVATNLEDGGACFSLTLPRSSLRLRWCRELRATNPTDPRSPPELLVP